MRSYQVRVGDEGQRWSTFDHIFHILTQEVCQVAEGAKDGKAGHEGGEAVGNADEEHVEDDVLVQVMLLCDLHIDRNPKLFDTDLVEPVEAGKGGHGGVASTE